MRYVLDASVAAKWVLPEAHSERARALRTAWQSGDIQLVAPDLFLPEIASILFKRCHLRKELEEHEAHAALALVRAVCPPLVASQELIEQALQLSLTFGRSVYDCLYIALALREPCEMVTADQALVRAVNPALGCLKLIAHWD